METGTQEVAASVMRHCTARLTHDKNWAIIEVAYEPTVHAQAARTYIYDVILSQGGSRHVGPPPPGTEERELRAEIDAIVKELGISNKSR